MGAANAEVIRWGPERARTGPWRGDRRVAHLTPLGDAPAPSVAFVRRAVEQLAERGFEEVVTPALSSTEQPGFLAAGFEVRERLHLLTRPLSGPLPRVPRGTVDKAGGGERAAVVRVDNRAFPPFWWLDGDGLEDAIRATPHNRFRVVRSGEGVVAGYAITGRAGRRGYLQRLAVDPDHQRQGLGRALVADGLRWLVRWRADRAVVNTPVGNDAAVALYEGLGFHREPVGLCVLARDLTP
ncbi:MAG TPA: GNAT family N-acetyltransferase [Acidimicrobiales bacterium]|nr:GNAT family N-acetyltransferase [Acidimicrobiales bacterium]